MKKNKKVLTKIVATFFSFFTTVPCLSGCYINFGTNNQDDKDDSLSTQNIIFNNAKEKQEVKEDELNSDAIILHAEKDIVFSIYSYDDINNETISSFCVVLDFDENRVPIKVKPELDHYIIYNPSCYLETKTYDIYINDSVFFLDQPKSVNHIRFTIDGEVHEILEEKDDIVEILNSEVTAAEQIDEDTYSIALNKARYDIETDTIFALVDYIGEPIDDGKVSIFKAVEVNYVDKTTYIVATYPELGDVYNDIDIYTEEDVKFTADMINYDVEEEIEEDLLNSEIYQRVCMALKATTGNEIKPSLNVKITPMLSNGCGVKVDAWFEAEWKINSQNTLTFTIKLSSQVSFKLVSTLKLKFLGVKGDIYVETIRNCSFDVKLAYKGSFDLINKNDDGGPKAGNGIDVGAIDETSDLVQTFKDSFKSLSEIAFTMTAEKDKRTSDDYKDEGFSSCVGEQEAIAFREKQLGTKFPKEKQYRELFKNKPTARIGFIEVAFNPQLVFSLDVDAYLDFHVQNECKEISGFRVDIGVGKCKTEGISDKQEINGVFVYLAGRVTVEFGITLGVTVSVVFCSWAFNVGVSITAVLYATVNGLVFLNISSNIMGNDKTCLVAGAIEIGIAISINLIGKMLFFKINKELISLKFPFYRWGEKFIGMSFAADDVIEVGSVLNLEKSDLFKMAGLMVDTLKMKVTKVDMEKFDIELLDGKDDFNYENGVISTKKAGEYTLKLKLTYNPELAYISQAIEKVFTIKFYSNGNGDNQDGPTFEYSLNESGDGCYLIGYRGDDIEIEVPESYQGIPVIGIDSGAFSGNMVVSKIKAPSVKSISDKCFYNCRNLRHVDLPNCDTLGIGSFENCKKLDECALSQRVLVIPKNCFSGCSNLRTINLNNVAIVEESAFSRCSSLDNISFGQNLKTIFQNAFAYCTSLRSVYLLTRNEDLNIFGSAFYKDDILLFVSSSDAEYYIDNLPTLSTCIVSADCISDGYAYYIKKDGTIGLIRYMEDEDEIVIPSAIDGKKVTSIGEECFKGKNMTSVTIPSSVTYIDSYAYKDCHNLTKVTLLSNSVVDTGVSLFFNSNKKLEIFVSEDLLSDYMLSAFWTWYKLRTF